MVHKGDLCSSVPMYTLVVHSIALYRLGAAQDDFARLLTTIFDGAQCSVLSLSVCVGLWDPCCAPLQWYSEEVRTLGHFHIV